MALIRTMCALIGAVWVAAMLPSSAAAAWPERPITLLHGFGAGGNGDLTARAVAERLSARLGQSVVVEPKPGAGGRVAAGFVARAPADGYTLLMLPGGHAASAAMQEQMNYHPLDDFTFIGLVTQIPFIVVTYPEHPIKTVPELIAAAKSASDPIIYSTSGVGTGQHLSAELFAAMADIKLKHLPSRGGTAVPTMLLGKHIELGFEPPPSLLELLKDWQAARHRHHRPGAVLRSAGRADHRRDHSGLRSDLLFRPRRATESACRRCEASQRGDRVHGERPANGREAQGARQSAAVEHARGLQGARRIGHQAVEQDCGRCGHQAVDPDGVQQAEWDRCCLASAPIAGAGGLERRQKLGGRTMACEQTVQPLRIGAAKPAFGSNTEILHDPAGRGYSRLGTSRSSC